MTSKSLAKNDFLNIFFASFKIPSGFFSYLSL